MATFVKGEQGASDMLLMRPQKRLQRVAFQSGEIEAFKNPAQFDALVKNHPRMRIGSACRPA